MGRCWPWQLAAARCARLRQPSGGTLQWECLVCTAARGLQQVGNGVQRAGGPVGRMLAGFAGAGAGGGDVVPCHSRWAWQLQLGAGLVSGAQ
jgi:hypothetical protein